MGYRSATLNTRLRRTRAGAFYATLRACFFAGDTPVAQHAVYFPDAFLTQMREAMPST
ncbi:rRNA (cytosine-C(5)-)-methyltransferase RsmF, partial [Salmonella enterica subsp. enterica serovar Enteritidis str. 648904 3-6]